MKTENIVFIARSLDGFIAGKDGEIDWLNIVPNPEGSDMGFGALIGRIDAIVMGRNTFELVCSFGSDWPYPKPVFVLSNTLEEVPKSYQDKAQIVKGNMTQVLKSIYQKGYGRLYIDGGKTIQSFLKEDLIDEMIVTTIPILLGGGISLFGELSKTMEFEHVKSNVFLNQIVQNHYKRKRV